MNRKPTPQSPGANAAEKRHISWVKNRGICAACGDETPVICHHMYGSSFRINKILVGHWAVLGLCQVCDNIITRGSRKAFTEIFDKQGVIWRNQIKEYPLVDECPWEVYEAITDKGQ